MALTTPIELDQLNQTLHSKGWAQILARLDQVIAQAVRDAIEAEGDDHLKAKGKYQGLMLARAIPETLRAELAPQERR